MNTKPEDLKEGDEIVVYGYKAIIEKIDNFNSGYIIQTDITRIVTSSTSNFKRL